MSESNSINSTSAGIVGNTGTGFVSSPATIHCVQVGGATSSTLVNITNGTTGQVLNANTGADPSWGAVPSSFSPNSTINIFDDFIGSVLQVPASGQSLIDSQLSWTISSGTLASASGTAAHQGIIGFGAAGEDINFRLNNSTSGQTTLLGGGVLSCTWVINVATLSTGTNTYILYLGLDDGASSEPSNGVYFVYSNGLNSGNWSGKTAAGGVRTTVNSATAVTTGWHNLTITVNAAATSVEFFVDGVSIGTSSTNIPTAGGQEISPSFLMDYSAGTIPAQALQIDLFYLSQTLTTPR